MKRISFCVICQKSFKNSASLASHRYRFHKSTDQMSGKEITSKPVDEDIKRKRIQRNDYISDQADNTIRNKEIVKKRPLVIEETSDDSDVEINRGCKRMRSFYEIFNDFNLSFKEQCDEYIKKLRFKAAQREKNRNEKLDREIEKHNMNGKEESVVKLESDESEDWEERRRTPSIRDVEGRCLVHEVILESLEKKGDRRFKKIEDSLDYLYKENSFIGTPYIEMALYNAFEIRNLFMEDNRKAIQFKIKELRNAAWYASALFECNGSITEEEHNLLDTLRDASIFEARTLLDENYEVLKSMFTQIPNLETLQSHFIKMKEIYDSEYLKIKNFPNDDEISETESESSKRENEDGSPERSDDDFSKLSSPYF